MSVDIYLHELIWLIPSAQVDHVKRTHDYEPFLREYLLSLNKEGHLNPMLGRDEDGKKLPTKRKAKGNTSSKS
jgi:ubiquitin carboxyl-terminal hydrolase L5